MTTDVANAEARISHVIDENVRLEQSLVSLDELLGTANATDVSQFFVDYSIFM